MNSQLTTSVFRVAVHCSSSPTCDSRARIERAGSSGVRPFLCPLPGEGAGAVTRGAGSISLTFAGHRSRVEILDARSRGAHTFILKVQVPAAESVQRMPPHDSGVGSTSERGLLGVARLWGADTRRRSLPGQSDRLHAPRVPNSGSPTL